MSGDQLGLAQRVLDETTHGRMAALDDARILPPATAIASAGGRASSTVTRGKCMPTIYRGTHCVLVPPAERAGNV